MAQSKLSKNEKQALSALKKAYAKKSRAYLKWLIKKEGIAEASMLKEIESIRR
jgi:hypothetical protein